MNRLYDALVDGLMAGSFGDWSSVSWDVSLHGEGAVFDPGDESLVDVGDQVGVTTPLAVAVDDAGWSQDGAVLVGEVPEGVTVRAVVVSVGGVPVAWFGTGGDQQPLGLVTTGEDVVVFGLGLRVSRPGG